MASAVLRAAGETAWLAMGAGESDAQLKASQPRPDHPGRRTTSACPWCHARALNEVLTGTMDESRFEQHSPYLVPAEIVYREGQIWMQKVCPEHGMIEDLLSSDAAFTARMESLYHPQDPAREPPRGARRKPSGLMLVIDLTNRCNMKCSPCFMDANHSSYVREASVEDVRQILDRAAGSETRRGLLPR